MAQEKTFYTQEQLTESLLNQMEALSELDRTINVNRTMKKVVKTEMQRIQESVADSFEHAVNQPSSNPEEEPIDHDPRQAKLAVKIVNYKKKLGGNVNIFKTKKSKAMRYAAVVTRTGGKSGKRRKRYVCQRTQQMESYWGAARNFILNWTETGTKGRESGTRYSRKGGWGKRSAIQPRPFFSRGAKIAERSVDIISAAYDTLIGKEFDKN